MAARAVIGPNVIVVEVLNKHNYEDWSELVQTYLEAQGLLDVVGTNGSSDNDGEDRRKKNAAALHAIKISCGPDAIAAIRGIHSAKIAWDTLEQRFKPILRPRMENSRRGGDGDQTNNNDVERFFDALNNGNWNVMKDIYTNRSEVLSATPPMGNIPVLHEILIRAHLRNIPIEEDNVVEMLRTVSSVDAFGTKNFRGATALAVAAALGNLRFAQCIVQRSPELVGIANVLDFLPLVLAVAFGRDHMARYLYSVTPPTVLSLDYNGKHGATLVTKSLDVRKLGKNA